MDDPIADARAEAEAAGVSPADADQVAAERSGDVIDRYKLLQQVGEGGMGTVWMAEQLEPVKRRVALKIVKLGMDTREVVRRFEAERQALALMDHPNIAKVLDGGATATGRPYFVMELVKGNPITDYCDQARLDLRERLGLFARVCEAIQHAHQKGVIHRDVKPSNVLVTLHDGVPVPKVIDFGIAKATNAELTAKTLFTRFEQVIGTPEYMAPEQAEMSGLDVDTRADVYSLGVLLYELLTGTTPFSARDALQRGYEEMLRAIREDDPVRPSTRVSTLGDTAPRTAQQRRVDAKRLGTALRGDLDWIVMKCLEKDRTRRYETANGLAADVRRHLADEPVEAGPPSAAYRMRKLVRRHRGRVVAGGLLGVALVLGLAGTSVGMVRARQATERAERELARASEIKRLIFDMLGSVSPEEAQGADTTLLKAILDDTAARLAAGEVTDELVAAELHGLIGSVYRDLGLYEEAGRHLPVALEIRTRRLGAEHPDTLVALSGLGVLASVRGAHTEAERLLATVLETRRRVLGEEHKTTLFAMSDLANVYVGAGRHAEADALFETSLEAHRRLLGDEHPDTLRVRSNLALDYALQGRLDEALSLRQQVLQVQRRVLGDEHPRTLMSMESLAGLYITMGRLEEAETLVRTALSATPRVFGDEHPRTLMSQQQLASLLATRGRYGEAEALSRTTLEARRRVFGDEDPGTLAAMDELATYITRQGRYAEAEELLDRSLATWRRTRGDDHPGVVNVVIQLAALYVDQRRFAEAEPLLVQSLERQRRLLGDENPSTLSAMTTLANVYGNQGRYGEAEELNRTLLEIRRRMLGDEHLNTQQSMNNLAVVYTDTGRYAEAATLYEELLGVQHRVFGPDHPETLRTLTNVAMNAVGLGRHDEAERLHRTVLEARRRALGDEHPDTVRSMINLANACAALDRLDEAEALRREALEIRRRVLGDEHPDTLLSIDNLIDVYQAQGRAAEAEPLLRERFARELIRAERPDADVTTLNNVAWNLLTIGFEDLRDPARALPLARRACAAAEAEGNPELWNYLDTLALAQHETGDPAGAAETERRALALAPADDPALGELEQALARYEAAAREAAAREAEAAERR